MSRREQDEETCGCRINLTSGLISRCPEHELRPEVPVTDSSKRNIERTRRVIR